MRLVCLQKIANKFLVPLSGKVWFGVWIDILTKEKFANLTKNFLFFSCFFFVSYLNFVYFIFILFCNFFYKVLSIASNEEMNELFYSL